GKLVENHCSDPPGRAGHNDTSINRLRHRHVIQTNRLGRHCTRRPEPGGMLLSTMSPRPLVLVPGACLGGWAWQEVAHQLRALGHDVYPVTLTGLGERVLLADESVDLDTHITDVLGVLDYDDLSDAVL